MCWDRTRNSIWMRLWRNSRPRHLEILTSRKYRSLRFAKWRIFTGRTARMTARDALSKCRTGVIISAPIARSRWRAERVEIRLSHRWFNNGRSTGEHFIDLLRALDGIEGDFRIRISSCEPNLLTDEIIDLVANSTHFAPHFHIPLQSGSNTVLKIMGRRYTRELFAERVAHIKAVMPHAFIGVDCMVGVRGETERCCMRSARVRPKPSIQHTAAMRPRCFGSPPRKTGVCSVSRRTTSNSVVRTTNRR